MIMFIDLKKKIELKKTFQQVELKKTFQQNELKKIFQSKSKVIYNQQQAAIRYLFNNNVSKVFFNQRFEVIRYFFNNNVFEVNRRRFSKNNSRSRFLSDKKIYIDVVFELNDELIYYVIVDNCCRLCIFVTCEQKVFYIIYN